MDRNIEAAPRDRLRFTEEIEALVLRILRHPEALVSDESLLWDFCVHDSKDGRPSGRGPLWCFFKTQWRKGDSNWQEKTIEARAVPFKAMTVRKIVRHTGVDVTPVFDKFLPEIFIYIRTNMPERYRRKLALKSHVGALQC